MEDQLLLEMILFPIENQIAQFAFEMCGLNFHQIIYFKLIGLKIRWVFLAELNVLGIDLHIQF